MKLLLVMGMILGSLLTANQAMAVVTADKMTCDQAVKYYKKHKRIYIIAHGKDVIPIYGMKSVLDVSDVTCGGRSNLNYYWVQTKDDDSCMIAVFCR